MNCNINITNCNILFTAARVRPTPRATSADAAHAELHRDPGADDRARLEDGVVPGALTTATHDHQITVTGGHLDRRASVAWAQRERTIGAEEVPAARRAGKGQRVVKRGQVAALRMAE